MQEDRKQFSLAAANPFANLLLLVRNGQGLRALSLSTALFRVGTSVGSLLGPFQYSPATLGWCACIDLPAPKERKAWDLPRGGGGAVGHRILTVPTGQGPCGQRSLQPGDGATGHFDQPFLYWQLPPAFRSEKRFSPFPLRRQPKWEGGKV